MDNHSIIKEFLALKDQLLDRRNYICFGTKNGRRLIVRREDTDECVAVTKDFKIVSFLDTPLPQYFMSPYDLIEGYYTDRNSISITEIFITHSKEDAIKYLIKEGKDES